jgi:hypothetical protein
MRLVTRNVNETTAANRAKLSSPTITLPQLIVDHLCMIDDKDKQKVTRVKTLQENKLS